MSDLMNVVKFGVGGIVIGATTAFVTDMVYQQVMAQVAPSVGTRLGSIGFAATQVVLAGSLSAVMVYGGDQVLSSIAGGSIDPLFHVIYYQTAVMTMGTAAVAMRSVSSIWVNLLSGISAPPTPKPQQQQQEGDMSDDNYRRTSLPCGKKGCGSGPLFA